MKPIFNRSFVTLLATLALALASCNGGDISKRRAAATGTAAGSTDQATSATPGAPADPLAGLSQAVADLMASAGVAGPAAIGTPAAPPFVWHFDNSPTPYPSPTTDTNCSHVSMCGWDVMQTGGAK